MLALSRKTMPHDGKYTNLLQSEGKGLALLLRYLLQLGQGLQRLLGLFLVQAADGKASVDNHAIPLSQKSHAPKFVREH